MHSLLFCNSSLFIMFCLQCFGEKYWVFYGVMYLFKERKKISKSSVYNSPPSSTQLYLCGMRFCSLRRPNQPYSLPILELFFYSSIELGILKIVMLEARFRALYLDSMSSMKYIWARNMGIFSWICVWGINFFCFWVIYSLHYTSFLSFLIFLVVG